MNTRTALIASFIIATSLVSGAAQASLIDRGGGLIYDTDLNVTWLQDANYAKTSGYDADGRMAWQAAVDWAANLSYYDSVRNVTYSDWRLPSVSPVNGVSFIYSNYATNGSSDLGYNITSHNSELAYMFYVNLGNPGYYTSSGTVSGCYVSPSKCLDYTASFSNLQSDVYWSGSEYTPYPGYPGAAWDFFMDFGLQEGDGKGRESYAWAVRPGDVAAVPEAQTYALILAGLGLVGWRARRRDAAVSSVSRRAA
jgi:hypothetical protein